MIRKSAGAAPIKQVRCAIYTRKSTEEGLDQEFNTLDAQRESAEAYIKSQQHEGWSCLEERYDDGGFSGGNIERPALKRLLADIEAGRIDCVVVYKVDRLSRSLLDFSRLMETFDRHGASFVSVTQQFSTTNSMGRLTLNILLSFAQFEREIISERTRDKIAATRRRGKWSGGPVPLGYNVIERKLLVHPEEAQRVRDIFSLYIARGALLPTVAELARRGWTSKRWIGQKGQELGGRPFDKSSLHQLLTNPIYVGQVRYKDELHPGEHEAIVDDETWQKVQTLLKRNGNGATTRNKHGALLRGLLRCVPCGCAMSHHYSSRGAKRYRYYVCCAAQKRGWNNCPSKSVPAAEIERFVVEQISRIGRDPKLIAQTVREVKKRHAASLKSLQSEDRTLHKELQRLHGDLKGLIRHPRDDEPYLRVLAEVQEQIEKAEARLLEVRQQLAGLEQSNLDAPAIAAALSSFHTVWKQLTPREQSRLMELLIERIDYDGRDGTLAISFHELGLQHLAQEVAA